MADAWIHPLRLNADPARVVVRPFHLAWQASGPDPDRVQRLARDIISLDSRTVIGELGIVMNDFGDRHWQIEDVFERRFQEIRPRLGLNGARVRPEMRKLIGAYFCNEYSYAAAALMNPSVVRHPDQTGLRKGSVRFLMSLRAVGEGHISSIAFREGIVTPNREMTLQPEPPFATAAMLRTNKPAENGGAVVRRHPESTISGTVIFPITEAQRNGLEDLRLVEFTHNNGEREWIGTYTAFSGHGIASEFLRTKDFNRFALCPIEGSAARNKGMALFPRKIGGRYCMLGRQDGKNLYLIRSTRIDHWDEGELLLEPKYPWEFIQIGNCGSPIELPEGWLVLTHGVGAMRKYSLGAILLDKHDPSRVLGRTATPILSAADEDREGYVPNVVYTCGGLVVGKDLFMPYGVADSSVCFGFFPVADILGRMQG
jgi:predicted GH43/DUF377 family glycosyl hydrolase